MARPLAEWISRRRAQLERLPQLEASLLAGRLPRYVGLRLGPLFANRLFGYALHLFEAVLLARFLDGPLLVRSFLISTVCRLLVAVHWSATEVLRSELRKLPSKGAVLRVQSAWLSAAAILAGTLFIGLVIGAHALIEGGPREWLAELYAIVVIGRMAMDLVVRTYYSCAYAFGRIYRPFSAIWAPQLAAFAALLLGAHLAGPLGVVLAIAVVAPIGRLITIVYTTRALTAHRRPLPLLALRSLRRHAFAWRRLVLASASGLLARAGQLAVLFIAVETRDFRQVAVSYALAPIVGAAAASVSLFYPDLKRLEGALSLVLLRRFVRALLVASVVAATLWLFIGWAVFRFLLTPLFPIPLEVPALLGALTIAVSIVAVVQMTLLARQQYAALLLHGFLLLGIVAWPQSPALASVLLLVSIVLGLWRTLVQLPEDPLPVAIDTAKRLVMIEVDLLPVGQSRRRDLAQRLALALPATVCRVDHRRLVIIADADHRPDAAAVIHATGGLVGALRPSPEFPRDQLRSSSVKHDLADIERRARAVVPTSQLIDLRRAKATLAETLLPALWREALARAHGRPLRAQREYHVAPVLEGSTIRALCLIPKDVAPATVLAWRAEVGGA